MWVRNLLVGIATIGVFLPLTLPVQAAGDTAELEARISELEAKVARLEALLEKTEVASVKPAHHPAVYKETGIKVGGYVKMDAMLSEYSRAPTIGVGEDFFIPATIATSGESRDPRLNFHAKETRFWLKSYTPTARGDITTHFEIDFMAGQQGDERVSNSYAPRLRHAALGWGRWTVGQTWTNFQNTSALPDYLDFIGPVGVAFGRQAQIRYTMPTRDGDWVVSLENPETTLTPFAGGSRIDADDSAVPDLVVRRNWRGDWGNLSVAALIRQLKIDQAEFYDTATGGAIGLAGKFMVGDRDDLRWQVNYGNGLGRYMGLNSFNAGALDANNKIDLTTQYGVLAAYRHAWNEQLYSSFGASFSAADNDPSISGFEVPESYQSAHADIVWFPTKRMSLGTEFIWARRKDESGDNGTLNRLQFSAKYLY